MADEQTRAEIYHLKGPEIELSYRRSANKLDIAGDDHLLTQDDLDAHTTSASEAGLHITATLLESSRNGTKVVLILLLPDVSTAGHERDRRHRRRGGNPLIQGCRGRSATRAAELRRRPAARRNRVPSGLSARSH